MQELFLMDRANNRFITTSHIRLLLVLIGFSLVWVFFAKLIAPPIIESAYRGESWSLFNRMIAGQAQYSASHYLQKWDKVSITGLVGGLGFYLVALVISSPAFFRRFVGEATAGSLGAIRMWTCIVLLLTTSLEDFASIALLPIEMRQYGGAMRLFYSLPIGFGALVTSETGLRVFQGFTQLVLILGAIGLFTRVVIPLGAFCHLLLLGTLVDYSFFWHQNLVLLYVMAVLSFTPCGDGWSLDRLWKIYHGTASPESERASVVYGWSRYACWLIIALPYLQAGLSKLRDGGLSWWSAANMRANLYGDALNPREFNWSFALSLAPAPDFVFAFLGIFAVLAELAFVMVLFSRIARRVLPVLAIMMHMGILALQRILFLDLILIQLVFFDFTAIRKRIGQWLARRRGRIQVLYDGFCPICQRSARLLASLDIFQRLEWVDFRFLDLNEYNRTQALNLKADDLEKQMYVISSARAYRGFYGYRVIALAIPAFWLLAPWLFVPGISSLGARIYRYIARHRMNLLNCDSHCSVRPVEPAALLGTAPRNRTLGDLRYSLALSAVVLVSSFCWLYHVEFYPFTSWDVYSYLDVSGKVTYVKVFGRDESGMRFPARFEDGIGALSYDGRYSRVIQKCFGEPTDVYVCKKFLNASASAYNKRAFTGARLTQYEIQKWMWDFRNHPSDPNYGKLTARFTANVAPGKALTASTVDDRSIEGPAPQLEPHLVKDRHDSNL
jgi:predicted DCC family thiol-disulfide oxidoreductase YuxK